MAMDKAAQRRVLDEIARDAGFVVDLDPTFDEDGALRHNLQPDVASDHTVEVVIPADAQTVPYVENVYTDGFNHLISSSVTELGDRNQRGTVIADAIDRFTVASSPAVDGYDFDADVQRLKDVYAESGTLDSGISFRDKGYMGVTELVVQSDSYAQDYYTLDTDVHGDMRARLQTYQGTQPRDAVEISSKDNPEFNEQLYQLVDDYNASAEKNHAAQMFFDRLGPEGVAEYLDTGDYVREDLTNLGTVREELLFDEDVVSALADHVGKDQSRQRSNEAAAYEASLTPLQGNNYSDQVARLDQLAYDVNAHMESHSYVQDVQGNIRREFDQEPGVDSRLALVLPADGSDPYVEARYYDKNGETRLDARSLGDLATAENVFNEVAHEHALATRDQSSASLEWGGGPGDEVAAYEASLTPLEGNNYSAQVATLDQLAYDVNAHMESHSYVQDAEGNIRREFDQEPGVDSRLALVLPADGGSPYVEARYYDEDGVPWFDARSLDDPATAEDKFNEVAHEHALSTRGREFADAAPARDDASDTARSMSVAERVQRVQGTAPSASKHNDAGFAFGK